MGTPKDLTQAETSLGTKRARSQKVVDRGRQCLPLTVVLRDDRLEAAIGRVKEDKDWWTK